MDNDFTRGWENGLETAANWHDQREAAMREVAENADPDLRAKSTERANWHRDCAAEIRKLME